MGALEILVASILIDLHAFPAVYLLREQPFDLIWWGWSGKMIYFQKFQYYRVTIDPKFFISLFPHFFFIFFCRAILALFRLAQLFKTFPLPHSPPRA